MWDSASSNGRLVEFLTACVLKATGKSTQFKKWEHQYEFLCQDPR